MKKRPQNSPGLKVEWCKFLGDLDSSGNIILKPLGKARNKIKNSMLDGWEEIETDLIIRKDFTIGLDGIADYSHVIVVYWIGQETECHLKHHPQGKASVPYVGIFACRCAQRPNRIGISTVKLMSRKDNVLRVKGLDIINDTLILDIKPYTPRYDFVAKTKTPQWIEKLVL